MRADFEKQWTGGFSQQWTTGIDELDTQNNRLFGLLKRLRKLNLPKSKPALDIYSQLQDILERLKDYLPVHFLQEELILNDNDPSYERHLADHLAFEKRIHIWMERLYSLPDGESLDGLASEMERFLSAWIAQHIWTMDLGRGEKPPRLTSPNLAKLKSAAS